jgi:MoaA/NifB/PqqE/SkfB family radical SAM enzyme
MELIIKPTSLCNFDCKFCSAYKMDILDSRDKVPEPIVELINKMKPSTLIITGGDPLMMEPEYYYNLHELCDKHISLTTNLKGFYQNPEKWKNLLNEQWIGIATSFHYGDTRMWDPDTVYDESMFKNVMETYSKYINKPLPAFISVIDYDNEKYALDHPRLAKELGTMCKINNMVAMGRQKTSYPRYRLFQIYLDIIDAGLEEYEVNCIDRKIMRCPFNVDGFCGSSIRSCYVDCSGKLHVSRCEDEMAIGIELSSDDEIYQSCNPCMPKTVIRDECYSCELFRLCNCCRTNYRISVDDPIYCEEMKKLLPRLIETGWRL